MYIYSFICMYIYIYIIHVECWHQMKGTLYAVVVLKALGKALSFQRSGAITVHNTDTSYSLRKYTYTMTIRHWNSIFCDCKYFF